MNKIIKLTVFICFSIIASCTEVNDLEEFLPTSETPETPDVISVTTNSVTFSKKNNGYYIYISTSSNLSDVDSKYTFGKIENLQPYTTYYYQGIKRNGVGTVLKGVIKSFTTAIDIKKTIHSGYYATASNCVELSAEIVGPATAAEVLEYGFCLSQLQKIPTLETADAVVIKGSGLSSSLIGSNRSYTISAKCTGTGMKKGLITYARAYVKTEKGVSYSYTDNYNTCWFFPVSGIKENRPYVDLGLPSGTLWATSNYDGYASTSTLPTEHSYYFSGGYYNSKFGVFRMPTYADAKELYENCTYKKVNIDNTVCAQITSNNNGNVIYIPLGGWSYSSGGSAYGVGTYGVIWLNTKTSDGYWRVIQLSDEDGIGYTYYSYYGNDHNIRLVLDN